MMVIDISAILDNAEKVSAQIQFCEVMAQKTASHDRDISLMYQSIVGTLRKLETPSQLTTSQHDPVSPSFSDRAT